MEPTAENTATTQSNEGPGLVRRALEWWGVAPVVPGTLALDGDSQVRTTQTAAADRLILSAESEQPTEHIRIHQGGDHDSAELIAPHGPGGLYHITLDGGLGRDTLTLSLTTRDGTIEREGNGFAFNDWLAGVGHVRFSSYEIIRFSVEGANDVAVTPEHLGELIDNAPERVLSVSDLVRNRY